MPKKKLTDQTPIYTDVIKKKSAKNKKIEWPTKDLDKK